MKRKLVAVMTVIAILMGLLACGSKDAVSQDVAEVTEEEPTPEETISEEKENTVVSQEPNEKAEIENEEMPEQKEDAPIWYMDEEGLKSEELGIKIRRDSAEWESFGFKGTFMIPVQHNTVTNISFECYYYEGNLDSYISEHEGMEKIVLDDVVYGLKESNEYGAGGEIVFVENGIALLIGLWDYDIKDVIQEGGLSFYKEDDMSCLAYIEVDTLYCPALGIKLSSDEVGANSVAAYTSDGNGGYISIKNEENDFFTDSIEEERFDSFVKSYEGYGTAIDETIEMSLGKNQFTGKGVALSYGGEAWLFFSSETANSISIRNKDEQKVEDYLSLIEELQ